MPVVNFHLTEGSATPDQARELLAEATRVYCEVLDAPVERVRAYITTHPVTLWATAGHTVADGGAPAPFFTAIVFADRPAEARHRLLAGFTDLLVKLLDVDRSSVRGQIIPVEPDDWGIGGEPASVKRAGEIAARAGGGPGGV